MNLGYSPFDIIVCGDSAGGHIAVAMVRYLARANLPDLPVPWALLLCSPTMDWANTQLECPNSTMQLNWASDYVASIMLNGYSATSLRGAYSEHDLATNPWLSPGSMMIARTRGLFAGFPPTMIIAGGCEHTLDGMRVFRDRLQNDIGGHHVTYTEYPDAFHDFLMLTQLEPERTDSLKKIDTWLKSL